MPIDIKPKLVGLAARKAAAEEANKLVTTREPVKLIAPYDAPERIGIIFDDSFSMSDTENENARAGVIEFLRSCKPNQTSVAVYPMNGEQRDLTSDLPALAMLVDEIRSSGGTPMFQIATRIVGKPLTRLIIFSDGEPTDKHLKDDFKFFIKNAEKQRNVKIPVDTVFLGTAESSGYKFMQNLAEEFGGIFLHFDPAKSNFRTAFKYLAPGYRALLADRSFVDKLEGKGK